MLIVATDQWFHLAGDGKLAGILRPSDMQCHLNASGYFNEYDKYDYPSIGQIRYKLSETNVTLLLAIIKNDTTQATRSEHENIKKYYDIVQKESLPSAFVRALSVRKDDTAIIDTLKEVYDEISSEIELTHAPHPHVQVVFRSNCTGRSIRETNKCSKLKVCAKLIDYLILDLVPSRDLT